MLRSKRTIFVTHWSCQYRMCRNATYFSCGGFVKWIHCRPCHCQSSSQELHVDTLNKRIVSSYVCPLCSPLGQGGECVALVNSNLLTCVVFCPEWRIHDHCVELVGVTFSLQHAHVTLDQIHVGNLKFLSISPEYLQSVDVNVESDTETETTQAVNKKSSKKRWLRC